MQQFQQIMKTALEEVVLTAGELCGLLATLRLHIHSF